MLTDAIRRSIDECILCWLATSSKIGVPNVSPKELFATHGDDKLIIANIASPQSVANIRENSAVCVSFVEIFKQKGFKLTGTATIIDPADPKFEALKATLLSPGCQKFRVRDIIKVQVERSARIIAPSYQLFPETEEEHQIEQAMKTYGVTRRPENER